MKVICTIKWLTNTINIAIIVDTPALVFKTLADVIKRETSPNSDEEGKLQES